MDRKSVRYRGRIGKLHDRLSSKPNLIKGCASTHNLDHLTQLMMVNFFVLDNNTSMIAKLDNLISQAEVELVSGLSREVIRKWEIRYGFPVPSRGDRGQRFYTPADAEQLRLIRQLLERGMQPRNVVGLPLQTLKDFHEASQDAPATSPQSLTLDAVLDSLIPDSSSNLDTLTCLQTLLATVSNDEFLGHVLPLLHDRIGNAWANGQLAVHAEHRYTEAVQTLLRTVSVNAVPRKKSKGKILLTTPPGELHGLGILGLHACLAFAGVDCVNLGTQTPAPEIATAATHLGIDVVAVSVSSAYPPAKLKPFLTTVRRLLPKGCALWVGGKGSLSLASKGFAGVVFMQSTLEARDAWLQRP